MRVIAYHLLPLGWGTVVYKTKGGFYRTRTIRVIEYKLQRVELLSTILRGYEGYLVK